MTTPTTDLTGLSRADRAGIRIFAGIALVAAVVTLIWGTIITIAQAADLGAPLQLLTSVARELDDGRVSWAEYSQTELVTQGLGGGGRALLATGTALWTISFAVTAGAIAYFLQRLAAGDPFHRRFSALTAFVGVLLTLGGLLGAAATAIGSMITAEELNQVSPNAFVVGFAIDPTPIFVGLAVLALSYVFRAGAHLQRDTEGLV